ncbi:Xylose isomerase-like TIM barrel [Stieleria maiorica]|uniref:Xylose isomerase-like TIM barrel n=2 Tax=Stieleria maiorica TaxID=2795974 RepID=A0A5B9M6Q7_9BACT|nr:Xylose isomerase-like TIM barrel [Stieleria maiorica]
MGLVIYDCNLLRKWMRRQRPIFDLFKPMTFLNHCFSLGAGGMQASLGVLKPGEVDELRSFADRHGMFIDAIVKPPKDEQDLDRFEAEIKTARDVGVQAARTTIIPGRRYERFKTLEEFREFEKHGQKMLELATPVVERHRVRLAVENHKDQRIDGRVALLKYLDSEFIGACVDTGNSFALLDGAYEPIEALAPYAFTVHLKDQSLRQVEDGFLLGDIPLGQGSFDLHRMVSTIRKAKPEIKFTLELITRDPLKVPCLTEEFFATMPLARASDLARTLQFVRRHQKGSLQEVSKLTLKEQVELEQSNVTSSIQYASRELKL